MRARASAGGAAGRTSHGRSRLAQTAARVGGLADPATPRREPTSPLRQLAAVAARQAEGRPKGVYGQDLASPNMPAPGSAEFKALQKTAQAWSPQGVSPETILPYLAGAALFQLDQQVEGFAAHDPAAYLKASAHQVNFETAKDEFERDVEDGDMPDILYDIDNMSYVLRVLHLPFVSMSVKTAFKPITVHPKPFDGEDVLWVGSEPQIAVKMEDGLKQRIMEKLTPTRGIFPHVFDDVLTNKPKDLGMEDLADILFESGVRFVYISSFGLKMLSTGSDAYEALEGKMREGFELYTFEKRAAEDAAWAAYVAENPEAVRPKRMPGTNFFDISVDRRSSDYIYVTGGRDRRGQNQTYHGASTVRTYRAYTGILDEDVGTLLLENRDGSNFPRVTSGFTDKIERIVTYPVATRFIKGVSGYKFGVAVKTKSAKEGLCHLANILRVMASPEIRPHIEGSRVEFRLRGFATPQDAIALLRNNVSMMDPAAVMDLGGLQDSQGFVPVYKIPVPTYLANAAHLIQKAVTIVGTRDADAAPPALRQALTDCIAAVGYTNDDISRGTTRPGGFTAKWWRARRTSPRKRSRVPEPESGRRRQEQALSPRRSPRDHHRGEGRRSSGAGSSGGAARGMTNLGVHLTGPPPALPRGGSVAGGTSNQTRHHQLACIRQEVSWKFCKGAKDGPTRTWWTMGKGMGPRGMSVED